MFHLDGKGCLVGFFWVLASWRFATRGFVFSYVSTKLNPFSMFFLNVYALWICTKFMCFI